MKDDRKGLRIYLRSTEKGTLGYKKEFCRILHVVEKLITESSDRETLPSKLEALKNSARKRVQEFVNWLNLAKEPEEIKRDCERTT